MDDQFQRADGAGGETSGEISPVGEPTDAQLKVINEKHARKPLSKDDVYVYRMEISNDRYDSYRTRMSPKTTLVNYRDDFKAGRPLQNSHNQFELPLGRSFDATLEEREKPKRTAVVVDGYITRGVKLGSVASDDVVRAIDSGQVKDASVRFSQEARYICDIDGKEMERFPVFFMDDRDEDACEHLLGVRYGTKVSTATIEDARAVEHSLVFKGSNNSTQLDRARALLAAGKLTKRQVSEFESMANVRMDAVDDAKLRKEDVESERAAATARVAEDFKDLSDELRTAAIRWYFRAGKSGAKFAMANGSYPINTCADVSDAAKLAHHSGTYSFEQVKAHVMKAKAALSCGDDVLPDTWKSDKADEKSEPTTTNGGMRLDPKTFVDLAGAAMASEAKDRIIDGVIAHMDEEVTPEFARAAAAEFVVRYGKTISADTASKIQAALDQLEDADKSKDAAKAALALLKSNGESVDDPEKGQPDLNKGDADKTDAKNGPADKKTGKVGRSEGDDSRAKAEPAADGNVDDDGDSKENGSSKKGKEAEEKGKGDADRDPGQSKKGKEAEEESEGDGDRDAKAKETAEENAEESAEDNEPDRKKGRSLDLSQAEVRTGFANVLAILTSESNDEKDVAARTELQKTIKAPEFRGLRSLLAQAEDGRAYRDDAVKELHEWGVRARSNGYNKPLYDQVVRSLSIEQIGVMAKDFRDEAIKRFENKPKGELPEWARDELRTINERIGRQTAPPPLHGEPKPTTGNEEEERRKVEREVDMFHAPIGAPPMPDFSR